MNLQNLNLMRQCSWSTRSWGIFLVESESGVMVTCSAIALGIKHLN
jgi:hypothetical protein